MSRDQWPPGPRDDDARPKPGHAEPVATTAPRYIRKTNPPRRQCGPDPRPWRRRREASWRMVPLADGAADPWRPWRPERVTPTQVQGAVDAAKHLLAEGLPPIFDRDTVSAMWRRGGADRQLAQELYELAGGVVA
jgi:hypothetical protein